MTQDRPILFRGATIVSMDPRIGVVDHGDLLIEDGRIASVSESGAPDAPALPHGGVDVIDGTGRIIIPGFIDTHRHMWEALLRSGASHHTLNQYYSDVLGDVCRRVTPDDAYVGTLASAKSALLSGITTVQDVANVQLTPSHTDASVAALRDSGLRTILAYGKPFDHMMSTGTGLPDDVLRVRSELLPHDDADVTMALLTEWGSDDDERHNAALADKLEVRTVRHIGATTPISRLKDLGVLRRGTTFIHGNGLPAAQLQIMADSGGTLSSAPAIELMMGHGVPAVGQAPYGLLISLSTSAEVVTAADMFSVMRAALQTGRQFGRGAESERELTAVEVLAMATRDGARSLGLEERTGTLTPGKDADLTVLRADELDVVPVVDPISTIVLQMDRRHIDAVYRQGRRMVGNGSLVDDPRPLIERLRSAADRLGPVPRTDVSVQPWL